MKKTITSFIIAILFLSLVQGSYAWYGAGNGTWPNATDGLSGKVVSPFYKAPPDSYTKNESITINFEVSDPGTSEISVNKPVFLKIFKITQSPKTQDLTFPNAGNDISISEAELYANNSASHDNQYAYRVLSIGNLLLNPGETSKFSSSFSLPDTGYYQFDLTDQDANTGYAPGHIYAAGFLRVVYPSSGNNGGGSKNGSNGSPNNSSLGNSSTGQTPSVLKKQTGFIGPFEAASTVSDEGKNILEDAKKQVKGAKIFGSQNCNNCFALPILLGELMVLGFYYIVVRKYQITKAVLKGLVIPALAFAVFLVINRNCGFENFFCRYFVFFDAGLFGFYSLVRNR